MKRIISLAAINIISSVVLLLTPLSVTAEPALTADPNTPANTLPPLIITKVQTGNAARADEFIELYNTSTSPVDLSGWRIHYITASVSSAKNVTDPSSAITLKPPVVDGAPALLAPGGYYLLYAGVIVPADSMLAQPYEDLLPATGGSIVLLRPDSDACEYVVEDALAWGDTTHLYGEGEALVPGSTSANDELFQRHTTADGVYVDAADNAADFAVTAAGSGATISGATTVLSQTYDQRFANKSCTPPAPVPTDPVEAPPETSGDSPPAVIETPEPEAGESETVPQPSIPAGDIGLKPPVLSELLPNPASPQADKDDEFIELYNPNDAYFDLSGYVLQTGLTTKHQYAIPDGTQLPPRAFLAFFSADTGVTLSNSGGQATFIDPLGHVLAQSDAYGTAKDGQAWVFAGGVWQWTTRPTPNAINVVSAPAVKSKSIVKKSTTISTASSKKTGGGQSSAVSDLQQDAAQAAAVTASSGTPVHPGVLALIAGSAVLYGAYEYRRDVANRFYQLRANRAARAAARRGSEGR